MQPVLLFFYVLFLCGPCLRYVVSLSPCSELTHQTSILKRLKNYTDKVDNQHRYQYFYGSLLQCSRKRAVEMLEIGLGCDNLFHATGPQAWRRVIPRATLNYIEYDRECGTKFSQNVRHVNGKIFIGDQSNITLLHLVAAGLPSGVDLIIDDGSHKPVHQVFTSNYLFPTLLRPGGVYVIEDMLCSFSHLWASNSDVSIISYISKLLGFLATAQILPKAMEQCIEVVCEMGICWFRKSTTTISSHSIAELPWCPPTTSDLKLETQLERQLQCVNFHRKYIYHVTHCEEASAWWGNTYFARGVVLKVTTGKNFSQAAGAVDVSSDALNQKLATVIVDDGTLPVTQQIAMFRKLYPTKLELGGYYFWEFPAKAKHSSEDLQPFVEQITFALYSIYCQVSEFIFPSGKKLKQTSKEGVRRIFSRKLCSHPNVVQNAFRVGCDQSRCFVQKKPWNVPPLRPYARHLLLNYHLRDDDIRTLKF